MPTVMIADLIPGMKVYQNITNKHDIILLSKGTILSKYIIEYLIKWKVESIIIEEEEDEIIDIRRNKQEQIANGYTNTLGRVEEFMEGLKGSSKLKLEEIRVVINEIESFTEITTMLQVINMVKNKNKYTYQHSMNVAMYSSFIGRWLGLSELNLKKLTYAALLHDIGKVNISNEILDKPGKLNNSEYAQIKKHTIYGYDLIKKNGNFSHSIALGILQHHERENGKGYPFGVTGDQIHLFAKIIAIADVYDAMTSNRAYKGRQSLFKTVEELISDSFGMLDPKITNVFANRLADFYIGATIILNNGDIGEIIAKNTVYPTKPLIKVDNFFIDLSKERHIEIQDVFITT